MKLLFDENLSSKLPPLVRAAFPDSNHVRQVGLKGQTDEEIWEYAKRHGFTIISKDKDFYQRALRSAFRFPLFPWWVEPPGEPFCGPLFVSFVVKNQFPLSALRFCSLPFDSRAAL
jgi:hypothetical protein